MDAKEKASQAEKILDGSEYKAESAREIAQDAQTHAEEASAKANTIRTEANKTKIEALRVGNEAEKLHQRVDITDSMMKEYEKRSGQDTNITTEANHKS